MHLGITQLGLDSSPRLIMGLTQEYWSDLHKQKLGGQCYTNPMSRFTDRQIADLGLLRNGVRELLASKKALHKNKLPEKDVEPQARYDAIEEVSGCTSLTA